jgi:carbon storage regulator
MLVLTRKAGQSIQIDSEIHITILSSSNGRVRLGFSAPEHIRIKRTELENSPQKDGEPTVLEPYFQTVD